MTNTQEKKVDSSPQKNVRVKTSRFDTFALAKGYAVHEEFAGDYSKIKVIRRTDGTFDVAYFKPLKPKEEPKKVSTKRPKKVKKKS